MFRGLIQSHKHFVSVLIVLTLLSRVLIPAGWMPSQNTGHSLITLCTGSGMVEAWVDAKGALHKLPVDKKGKDSGQCAFAGVGAAAKMTDLQNLLLSAAEPESLPFSKQSHLIIGLGLAAPPPPATGPPVLI
jgi:hypothetical protein